MFFTIFLYPRRVRLVLLLMLSVCFSASANAEMTRPPFDFKGGPVTLQKAIDLAITHNPVLNASRWEQWAMNGRVIQAGLPPNPEIEAETENFAGSREYQGFGAAETKLYLSQLIELGGKRARRSAYAALGRDLAQWDYEITRANVVAKI